MAHAFIPTPSDPTSPRDDAPTPLDAIACRRVDHRDPADRERVLRILSEYFASVGQSEDANERYAWLYLANPSGPAHTFVAKDKKTQDVVAITSIFPRSVSIDGKTFMGAIGGDGYVTPAYRRRGIATLLHNEALFLMTERDQPVGFMFGPPEPHNLKALLRAGASLVGSVQRFVRPLTWTGLGAAAARVASPSAHAARLGAHAASGAGSGSRRWATSRTRVDRLGGDAGRTAGHERIIPVRDASFTRGDSAARASPSEATWSSTVRSRSRGRPEKSGSQWPSRT